MAQIMIQNVRTPTPWRWCTGVIFTAAALIVPLFCGARSTIGDAPVPLKVAVTTSHLGELVRSIGGERVAVVVLVPGSMCPGHSDVSPAVVRQAAAAHLFLRHDWEQWADDWWRRARVVGTTAEVAVEGNWMVPERNLDAAAVVKDHLIRVDPSGAATYQRNFARYRKTVERTIRWLDRQSEQFRGIPVVGAVQQREFLQRLGCIVAATYGRAEDLSAGELARVIDKSRSARVKIVVDNLQSGSRTGEQLARDLGLPHVTLTNFPLEQGYFAALRNNVMVLREALRAAAR